MEPQVRGIEIARPSPLPLMGVSRRKRSVFYMQLARMLDAGISPVRALTTLADQPGSRRLTRAARDMTAHIQSGGSLASAFARHPNVFPENEVRMVEASEAGGESAETMLRIAAYLDRMTAFWGKLATGLIYPVFVLVMAFFGIPILLTLLFGAVGTSSAAVAIPLPFLGGGIADVLFAEARFLAAVLAIVFGIVTLWRWLSSTSWPRVVIHSILLHLPVFGKLASRMAVARFADMFECLYSAGVRAPEAMVRAANACGNAVIARRILDAVPVLQAGGTVTATLSRSRALPPMALNMVAVGEESGNLDEALTRLAEYEHSDARTTIERIAKVLPLLVILGMVLTMGYMVLSMWLNLYGSAFRMLH